MDVIDDWDDVVRFHGHSCMGLALGYRASKAGLNVLGATRSPDEELVAIVETDSCAVDALQVLAGCTMGKGNLLFRDYGKTAFTIGRRDTDKAVRIVVRNLDKVLSKEFVSLRYTGSDFAASETEMRRFQTIQDEAQQRILHANEDTILEVEWVDLDFPAKARIFSSVTCSSCGEQVMEPRARLYKGKLVCIPCSEAAITSKQS